MLVADAKRRWAATTPTAAWSCWARRATARAEFYRARAAVTRRLIERHGFDFVAGEADWPDAAAVDRHVRLKPHRAMAPPPFSRLPTWMRR
jgi:erythromycin esterase-like protein